MLWNPSWTFIHIKHHFNLTFSVTLCFDAFHIWGDNRIWGCHSEKTKGNYIRRLKERMFLFVCRFIYSVQYNTERQIDRKTKTDSTQSQSFVPFLETVPGQLKTQVHVTCLAFPRCLLLLAMHRFTMHTDSTSSRGNFPGIRAQLSSWNRHMVTTVLFLLYFQWHTTELCDKLLHKLFVGQVAIQLFVYCKGVGGSNVQEV